MTDPIEPNQQAFYGKDCPKGMVQIEFVGCMPEDRYSNYGWKPVKHAFLEVYIDGQRLRIEVGDFHDGHGQRRDLHIIGPVGMQVERTAMNAASVYITDIEVKQ